jgi:hypothetical protein
MSSSSHEGAETTDPMMTAEETVDGMSPYVIAIVVGGIIAAAYYYFSKNNGNDKQQKLQRNLKDVDIDDQVASNTVGLKDITYIASKLNPDSTHLDILLAVASTPESIAWGVKAHEKRQQIMEDRMKDDEKEAQEKKKESSSNKSSSGDSMFDLDDEGWADDNDETEDDETKEKAKLAKQAEEDKKKAREQLKKVNEKPKFVLEGLDDGVIGQNWVEKVLSKSGAWPPADMRFLDGMTFDYEGKQVAALDHPGLRRNLCHIAGRINSVSLNSHPELSKSTLYQSYESKQSGCIFLLELRPDLDLFPFLLSFF